MNEKITQFMSINYVNGKVNGKLLKYQAADEFC